MGELVHIILKDSQGVEVLNDVLPEPAALAEVASFVSAGVEQETCGSIYFEHTDREGVTG